ncbi:MAG: DUF2877 domain-containing protein [Candidatus Rokubacteria bacterium]|nr:DUF2877 domain-containing protein [Candidatus Rokubacteria bacterium]
MYTSVVRERLRLRALRVSRCVYERLPERGALAAIVHSAFRRVANLRLDSGDLLSLSAPEVALAPNAIALDLEPGLTLEALAVERGRPATLSSGALRIPGIGLEVTLAGAVGWEPRPRMARVSRGELAVRQREARGVAIADGVAESLLPLLWLRDARGSAEPGRPAVAAGVAAARLGDGAARSDADAVSDGAAGLAGLGPGLTPSGDDLLAGFAAAWRLAGEATQLPDRKIARTATAILSGASGRTSELGGAWLAHAVEGEVAEPMGEFFTALAAAGADGLAPAVRRVLALGATSGTDWLVGALLGIEAVLSDHARERP